MLSHRNSNKAQHLLRLLDEARCSGNLEEVARLRLKITKHLPQRKCLLITIATDYTLSTQSLDYSSASSSLPPFDYSQRVSEILTALKYGNPTQEDGFQAEVCLSWLHWTIKEPSLALSRLPPDLAQIPDRLTSQGEELAGWTHVCIVKGAYIRGVCHEKAGNLIEAVQSYESMLPYISNAQSLFGSTIEHRRWTERLLARYCLLTSRYVQSKAQQPKELLLSSSLVAPTFLLAPFRAWAEFWVVKSDKTARIPGEPLNKSDISPIIVWQAYYGTLSILLRIEAAHPSISAPKNTLGKNVSLYETEFFAKSRSQQFVEFKRVESIYEDFLLNELKFPKANEATPEIEAWVDQVMANWRVLCGTSWLDEDHGDGGKEATGRNVLAILYRAATRSFHSTRILRYLLTVHTSLADFGLAGKALDTYFEIVTKGKARVQKSGEQELGLDDDATAIWTAAEGIKMLCFYGRRKEAERAMELSGILKDWLQPHYSQLVSDSAETPKTAKSLVHGPALAAGFCALGISQAHWANLTYECSARSDLQRKAISNIEVASGSIFGDEKNIEIIYYYSLALFRARDLDTAIAAIKKALSNYANKSAIKDSSFGNETEFDSFPDARKRRFLVRSWHLLAILLSSKQNFSMAISSCEAALELFGIQSVSGRLQTRSLESNLEMSDKESIIEIKMTQLALAEVVEGPEEAVNASGELLGLYTKLFRYSEQLVSKEAKPASESTPASRNGTIKSLRGSFLSHSKKTSTKAQGIGANRNNFESGSFDSRESPETTRETPTITVNAEDNLDIDGNLNHSHHLVRHESKKLRKRNSKKSIGGDRRSRASSLNRRTGANGNSQPARPRQDQIEGDPLSALTTLCNFEFVSDEVGLAISHDLPSSTSSSYATRSLPQQSKLQTQTRLNQPIANKPTTSSIPFSPIPPLSPVFPPTLQRRHALTLLAKIWLLIASLYRRANMHSDAQGALAQATTHVIAIESAVASSQSSAEGFSTVAWGGLKSIAELSADVLAEKGRLHLALGDSGSAEEAFEGALDSFQDHPGAIVGLAEILLDFYSQSSLPLETEFSSSSLSTNPPKSTPTLASLPTPSPPFSQKTESEISGNLLHRLSARDRAYGLLSSLTKSGRGWDCAEAWFGLGRAYEAAAQLSKAREAFLWVVELEEGRPVRAWDSLGGFS